MAPNAEDWRRAKSEIVALCQPGALITSAPRWTDPLLRQAMGAELMPIELLARADNDNLEQVVEISFGGSKDGEFMTWPEQRRLKTGPFLVRVLANPRPEPAKTRLLDRVAPGSLEVAEGDANHERGCPYTSTGRASAGGLGGDPALPPERFACPSGEPYLVAVTTIDDEHFKPRRCIWAHLSPNGPLKLRFREVRLGAKLVGHAGLPWLISRDGVGTDIGLAVKFQGAPVGQVAVKDTAGWMRFEWSTAALGDEQGELEVIVSSERFQNRRFCFTLESR